MSRPRVAAVYRPPGGWLAGARHRAYSLLELVICLVILTIIFAAVESAVRVTARAIPDGRSTPSATALAAQALDTLTQDLTFATAVQPARMTANDLELIVPDRNGDGAAETVRYQWAGSGAAVTRQVNGGAVVPVAANVSEFALVFDKRAQANPATTTESPEVVLSSYDPQVTLNTQRVNSGSYCGQYFVPALPADATAWRVTRVMLKVGIWGASKGQTLVRLRTASGGLPTGSVVGQVILDESTLTNNSTWTSFTYANAGALRPADGLCVTLEWMSDSDSCGVEYVSGSGGAAAANLVSSGDGLTWSAVTTDDLVYYVYGTYSTPAPVTYTYRLTNVRCALRVGADPYARCGTSARMVNEPSVAGP
jgi:hypothetical protein